MALDLCVFERATPRSLADREETLGKKRRDHIARTCLECGALRHRIIGITALGVEYDHIGAVTLDLGVDYPTSLAAPVIHP